MEQLPAARSVLSSDVGLLMTTSALSSAPRVRIVGAQLAPFSGGRGTGKEAGVPEYLSDHG